MSIYRSQHSHRRLPEINRYIKKPLTWRGEIIIGGITGLIIGAVIVLTQVG